MSCLPGLGCLLLGGLPSAGLGLSSAWVVFCLGLCGASCCGFSEMSHAIPRHVFQTLKSHRWNCNVLGCCTKFGYPNCVRVLVDEAPEASSCVRSSFHDTVHDPRDASNTTPTPQNAKSPLTFWGDRVVGENTIESCSALPGVRCADEEEWTHRGGRSTVEMHLVRPVNHMSIRACAPTRTSR